MELIAHQPIATLVASLFQLTRQPDAKGQSLVTRRSHGQFDLESCPVQYPWLNPLLMLNMNLQNVNQDHFSLASLCSTHFSYRFIQLLKLVLFTTRCLSSFSLVVLSLLVLEFFPSSLENSALGKLNSSTFVQSFTNVLVEVPSSVIHSSIVQL